MEDYPLELPAGNPLSRVFDRNDLDKINRCLARCAEGDCVVGALQECGLDFSEQQRRIRLVQDVVSKIKAKAFPGEP